MSEGKRDVTIAWFGALCFFLSTVEYMIPKPLPFLRLGLANLPLMLAVDVLPVPAYLALALVKIAGQGLIGGTLFSYVFAFSAAGSIASAALMLALKKALRDRISWIGVSVAGAFASNAAQLTLARYWVFGESAWVIMPPFLAVGAVTGALLGAFANAYSAKSEWYASMRAGRVAAPDAFCGGAAETTATPSRRAPGATAARFAFGLALIAALLFADDPAVQGAIVALAIVLVLSRGMRVMIVPAVVMTASVVAFNLLVPFGKVLASPFGLPITEGALRAGVKKALAVEGMMFVSRWMLHGGLRLPGRAGAVVSESFGILARLTAGKGAIDLKNPIPSLDRLMSGRD